MTEGPAFLRANPGFALDFQLVDVPDFQGRGESEPMPHFYQARCLPATRGAPARLPASPPSTHDFDQPAWPGCWIILSRGQIACPLLLG